MKCYTCDFLAGYEEDRCGHADYDKPICAIDADRKNCPVTARDKEIIGAIGKGIWRCDMCEHDSFCAEAAPTDAISWHKPCCFWKLRKE